MIGILLLSHISSFFFSFFRRSTARGEYVWRSLANGTLKDNLFVFFFLFFVLFWVCLFSLIPFVRVLRLTGSSLFNYRLLVVFLILLSLVWSLSFCFLLDLSSVFYALLLHLSLLFFPIFIVVFIILLSFVFGLLFDLLLYIYHPFPRTLPPHLSLPIHHLIVISISILSHLSPHHHIYPLIVFCFNSPVQFPIISITRFLSLPSPSSSFAFVLLFCVFGWPLTFDGVTLPCLRLGAR